MNQTLNNYLPSFVFLLASGGAADPTTVHDVGISSLSHPRIMTDVWYWKCLRCTLQAKGQMFICSLNLEKKMMNM